MCKIENRYGNKILDLIQLLSKKPSEQNNDLVQICAMIEGLFLVSVNMIHDACFSIPYVSNTDENIVLYINSGKTWIDKL